MDEFARARLPTVRGPPGGLPGPLPRAPSREAQALLLSSVGYLLLLCGFLLFAGSVQLSSGSNPLPDRLVDDRDLLALFGWVGMMISGVSVIVIPNHFGVPLRPRAIAGAHLIAANLGIGGFFVLSLVAPATPAMTGLLMVAVGSFAAFALSILHALLSHPGREVDPAPRLSRVSGSPVPSSRSQ